VLGSRWRTWHLAGVAVIIVSPGGGIKAGHHPEIGDRPVLPANPRRKPLHVLVTLASQTQHADVEAPAPIKQRAWLANGAILNLRQHFGLILDLLRAQILEAVSLDQAIIATVEIFAIG